MWFKNIQIYQLGSRMVFDPEALAEKLEELAFTPCLPTLAESLGWISPIDQEGRSLVYGVNGYMMFCLQFEEKILPATVIREAVKEKVKEIEADQDRKVRAKEKQDLKEAIIYKLRPQAFSRFTKVHAYIDTKNNLLIINTTSTSRLEKFLAWIKRSLPSVDLINPVVKKPNIEMTNWLMHQSTPGNLIIDKTCMLQDPSEQSRVVRCKDQNLSAPHVQAFMKDGYEVKQLALIWQDHIRFTLTEMFNFKGIRFEEELLTAAKDDAAETPEQQFDADFLIMTETLTGMISELLGYFLKPSSETSIEQKEEVTA